MIRSILVPLDGSELAERALPHAAALAAQRGAALHLVTVHQPQPLYSPAEDIGGVIARVDRDNREREGAYLERRKEATAAAHAVDVTAAMLDGDPATELGRYVADREIDLVVMTTHGRSGMKRLWLGSVADRLVRFAECPVLLLRADVADEPEAARLFERVLVALDGSAFAEAALGLVRDLTWPEGGSIQLLTVVQPSLPYSAPPPRGSAGGPDALSVQQQMLVAYRYLRRVADADREAGRRIAAQAVPAFDVAGEIVEAAAQQRATLIALASRGRGGLGRIMLGSVADRVVRLGRLPVLVYRAASGDATLAPDFVAALEEPDSAGAPAESV